MSASASLHRPSHAGIEADALRNSSSANRPNSAQPVSSRAMKIALSDRIQELAPSPTLAGADRVNALREQGVDIVSFATGEPDFDTPEAVKQAAMQALRAGDTRYPSPVSGKKPLRAAIAQFLQRTCGLTYAPEQIVVTVGAKDALFMAFAALLNPGDEAIVPAPYWVSYPPQISLAGGVPVFIAPSAGAKIRPADLRAKITPRTRVLVLNSPSNPSGAVYSRRELEELFEAIRPHPITVVSDEIYHQLIYTNEPFCSAAAVEGMSDRALVVNGMSKTYAMTGWRLGFAAGPADLISAMARLQGQTTSGPASFVQTAAVTAIEGDQSSVAVMRNAYRERRDKMWQALNAITGIRCEKPDGAFYCFPDVSAHFERLDVRDADGFSEILLQKANVFVVSGVAFGAPRHVRLTFAIAPDRIDEGMQRIGQLLR
jgi:aspartate aminotransferase